MALASLLSSKVRGLVWSVIDWSLVTPVKNILRPVSYLVQYSTCVVLLSGAIYGGWTVYNNPSVIYQTVIENLPFEIRIKSTSGDSEISE